VNGVPAAGIRRNESIQTRTQTDRPGHLRLDIRQQTPGCGSNGASVMEGPISNGVDGIVAECDRDCMSATCHVYVDEFLGDLEPMAENEPPCCNQNPNSRLGCQNYTVQLARQTLLTFRRISS